MYVAEVGGRKTTMLQCEITVMEPVGVDWLTLGHSGNLHYPGNDMVSLMFIITQD